MTHATWLGRAVGEGDGSGARAPGPIATPHRGPLHPPPPAAVLAAVVLAAGPGALRAQGAPGGGRSLPSGPGGWNEPAALALAGRAVEARRRSSADLPLRSFEARAEGHVYFLGEFAGERQLVRADQVALRILWEAPDRALQTIVGRRHRTRLPTNIRYHIDHLSVVLDNLGDRIELGEGQEVRHVLHPAAPGALDFYDYRLADSSRIGIRGRLQRLYRLEVRPRDPGAPGVVGSLYVEKGSGAIVRMAVTFTSPAYVDPTLDYIHLDLRSGLWDGRYWLPAEQEVEIRRQLSWLSFPVGGIIRTRFRIFDYRLNRLPGRSLAPGQRVVTLPPEAVGSYDGWTARLGDGPLGEGEESDEALRRLEARARELVGPRALVGSSRLQLHLPGASGTIRARRAEGFLAGGGVRYRAGGSFVSAWLGYPFARAEPETELRVGTEVADLRAEGALFVNRLGDIGPFDGAAGALGTVAFAFRGEDYADPYFEDGGEVQVSGPLGGGRASVGLLFARQSPASLEAGPLLGAVARPVRPAERGTMAELRLEWRWRLGRALGAAWEAGLRARAGVEGPGDFGFRRLLADLRIGSGGAAGVWQWSALLAAGVGGGRLPPQRLFLLGGRGTVPGYPYRAWAGDRLFLATGEVSRDVAHPWLRARALVAAGWTQLTGAGREAAARLEAADTGSIRTALGLGAGLVYDILRVELVRGLEGGEWAVLLSVAPSLWSVL